MTDPGNIREVAASRPPSCSLANRNLSSTIACTVLRQFAFNTRYSSDGIRWATFGFSQRQHGNAVDAQSQRKSTPFGTDHRTDNVSREQWLEKKHKMSQVESLLTMPTKTPPLDKAFSRVGVVRLLSSAMINRDQLWEATPRTNEIQMPTSQLHLLSFVA